MPHIHTRGKSGNDEGVLLMEVSYIIEGLFSWGWGDMDEPPSRTYRKGRKRLSECRKTQREYHCPLELRLVKRTEVPYRI